METGYRTLADKPYESHYQWVEIEIDAPVETVWPLAVRIGDWMNSHRLVTLDGAAGQVGHFERAYPANIGDDVPEPHHHLYGIAHLVPHRYIALEVFPERNGSYGVTREWTMFDQILLNDLADGRTRVAFGIIDILRGEATPGRQQDGPAEELLVGYLHALKAQAEEAARVRAETPSVERA